MPYKRISAVEAQALMGEGDVTLLDIRDPDSYSAGHIASAIHVSDRNIETVLTAADKSKPVVIYCYHGNSSQGAADYFHQKGFAVAYSVDGGYEAWHALLGLKEG